MTAADKPHEDPAAPSPTPIRDASISVFRHALPEEANNLVRLVTDAFLDLPPTRWLLPPDTEPNRQHIFARYFAIFLDHAYTTGSVLLSCYGGVPADDYPVSVALWWDGNTPEPPNYDQQLTEAVGEQRLPRFRALDERMAAAHPKDVPHTHLAFAATRPAWQGLGWGTALLTRHHTALDQANLPAYLEAGSARARDLYRRLGYQLHGTPFRLPAGGPTMWPMWRCVHHPPDPAHALP